MTTTRRNARFSQFQHVFHHRLQHVLTNQAYFSTNGIFQLVQGLRFVTVHFPLQVSPQEKIKWV